LKIADHKLVEVPGDHNLDIDLTQRWAKDRVIPLTPKGIVIHYDVCQTLDEQTGSLFASGLSYHVGLDGRDNDGKPPVVRQYVPFNRQGVHAKGHNHEYIGVCIVNPGPVIQQADGTFRDVHKRPWPADQTTTGIHASGLAPKNWTHWASFSYEERDAVLEICKALVEAYPTISTICGHDWLSPGQKFDPGPAADDAIMAYIRGAFPNLRVPEVESKV
jgi:N-acetyl-anhydromuramyl-L-alanine amidase AmpD